MLPALITLSACIPLASLIGYVLGVRIERRRNARCREACRYWQPSMYVDPGTTPEMYRWAPQDRFN